MDTKLRRNLTKDTSIEVARGDHHVTLTRSECCDNPTARTVLAGQIVVHFGIGYGAEQRETQLEIEQLDPRDLPQLATLFVEAVKEAERQGLLGECPRAQYEAKEVQHA